LIDVRAQGDRAEGELIGKDTSDVSFRHTRGVQKVRSPTFFEVAESRNEKALCGFALSKTN